MRGICARLEHHADRATSVAAVFGGVVIFHEAELFHGLGIRIKNNLVAGHSIV